MNLRKLLSLAAAIPFLAVLMGSTPVFPQEEGKILEYTHSGADGKFDASCVITLKNVSGDINNGHIEMIYNCKDAEGKNYFSSPNEFKMVIDRVSGQTYITMDKMFKTLKVSDLIMAGDPSSIQVPMTVGKKLPDTKIFATLGPFKATLTISEKEVLNRKTLSVAGHDYDCYLVHEKILTQTPFGTDTATADTWYAEGVGTLSQTVYDAKGRLKGKLKLINCSKNQTK